MEEPEEAGGVGSGWGMWTSTGLWGGRVVERVGMGTGYRLTPEMAKGEKNGLSTET